MEDNLINKLELKDINKKIGNEIILKDINLVFESGKVYVLSGDNGSGKTMLIRLIAGLIYGDTGDILFNDIVQKKYVKRIFSQGIIIENDLMYERLSLKDNLNMLASINKKVTKREIDDLIKRVNLEDCSNKKLSQYSLGMKKRAMIAQSILDKPDVLLWDEPCNGLDEESRQIFYDICLEEKRRGAIIIISSHIHEDLSVLADEVIKISKGEVLSE